MPYRGFVTYSRAASRTARIRPRADRDAGSVSDAVARAMAEHSLRRSRAGWHWRMHRTCRSADPDERRMPWLRGGGVRCNPGFTGSISSDRRAARCATSLLRGAGDRDARNRMAARAVTRALPCPYSAARPAPGLCFRSARQRASSRRQVASAWRTIWSMLVIAIGGKPPDEGHIVLRPGQRVHTGKAPAPHRSGRVIGIADIRREFARDAGNRRALAGQCSVFGDPGIWHR